MAVRVVVQPIGGGGQQITGPLANGYVVAVILNRKEALDVKDKYNWD